MDVLSGGTFVAEGVEGSLIEGSENMAALSSKARRGEAGYGVLEIAVVVMVAGLLTAASVVMFDKGKARYQLSQKAQDISLQIERARSLAVKYNQTLTLGFSSENSVFGLTCSDCSVAKSELPPSSIPRNLTLSAYPTITIKGNGTIQSTNGTIVVNDSQSRQVTITIANSGRTGVGDLREVTATRH